MVVLEQRLEKELGVYNIHNLMLTEYNKISLGKVWKDERIFRIHLEGIPFPFTLIVTISGVPFSDALRGFNSTGPLSTRIFGTVRLEIRWIVQIMFT